MGSFGCEVDPQGHLCFFVRRMVERLDLSATEQAYGEEGQPGAAGVGVAVHLRVWDHQRAVAGAEDSRGLGVPLFDRGCPAELLDTERLSAVGAEGTTGDARFPIVGLVIVEIELALVSTAYNLTRMWRRVPDWGQAD